MPCCELKIEKGFMCDVGRFRSRENENLPSEFEKFGMLGLTGTWIVKVPVGERDTLRVACDFLRDNGWGVIGDVART